jgi:4-hydroxy-3-methylbut-2-enyl diphosphate reductase IspH
MEAFARISTYGVNERNASKVHVVMGILLHNLWVVDRFRSNILVPTQLSRAEQEREKVVIIQPPYTV